MASLTLTGSFQGTNASKYALKCDCTSTSNGINANSSNVTVKLYMRRTASMQYPQWNLNNSTYEGALSNITIDGTSKGTTITMFDTRNTTDWILLTSFTKNNIAHNADGSKSVSISATFEPNATSTLYGGVVSGTFTLDKIPRISSFSLNKTSVALGETITATINRASSEFVHKTEIWVYDKYNTYRETKTGQTTSSTFTIPTSWYAATNGSSSITGCFRVETWLNGARVDKAPDQTFTITVPSGTGPTIGSFTAIPVAINGQSVLLQNTNQVKLTASGCSGGYGSSISYQITGSDIAAINASSATIGPFATSGSKSYTLTVRDAGGRTATATVQVACVQYSPPFLTTFNAYRSKENGDPSEKEGTYITFTSGISFSSVNNTNTTSIKFYYREKGSDGFQEASVVKNQSTSSELKTTVKPKTGSFSTDKSYDVYAIITDAYGGSSQTQTLSVYNSLRILNISRDGTGFAIGKMAEANNLLDVRWPIRTDDPATTMNNFTVGDSVNATATDSNDTAANWIDRGNLATSYYTANINNQSINGLLLNVTNGSTMSHHILAASNGSIYHRSGTSNNLSSWNQLLDKPVTLYNNASGTTGTVTLSESAANFEYLEIFYMDNNNRQPNSIKICSPNGKYVTLSCIEPSTDNAELRVYIRSSGWTISGTSMTPGRSDLGNNHNNCIYAELKADGSTTEITRNAYIKIARVLGYR